MSDCGDPQAAEHGFTLLELLVAITLLGLLMAALFGGLRLGARVWETADARLEASMTTQVVQDFIRQRLTEMLPLETMPLEVAEPAASASVFVGTTDAVRFASLLPENLGAGVYLIELALAEGGQVDGTGNLVLRWHPLEPDERSVEEVQPEERVLIENVLALELSYFGTLDSAQPPDWWQVWEGRAELPRLIRLRLSFPENDQRDWPELIVQPMVDQALAFGF
jgi:general secretion pathway protein J